MTTRTCGCRRCDCRVVLGKSLLVCAGCQCGGHATKARQMEQIREEKKARRG